MCGRQDGAGAGRGSLRPPCMLPLREEGGVPRGDEPRASVPPRGSEGPVAAAASLAHAAWSGRATQAWLLVSRSLLPLLPLASGFGW